MGTKTVFVAILAVFALSTPAQAGWKLHRAEAIAKIVWHNPCVDRMQVEWAPLYNADAAAEAYTDTCVVRIRPGLESWNDLCYAMIHEAGHLAGQPHSDDPNSVMYPTQGTNWRCRDRGRPYLEQYGTPWDL